MGLKIIKKDFKEILTDYKIGNYKSHKHLDWVLENQVYELKTTKGKFILKLLSNINIISMKRQLELIDYLYKNKIPVVKNIKTTKGKEIIKFKGAYLIIQSFVEGIHPKTYSDSLIKDIAKNFGKMHNILIKQKIKNKKIKFKREILQKEINNDLIEDLNELNTHLNKLNQNKFKKSIIHGDLSEVNILVKKNKLQAFIDWDDFNYNLVVYDLGVFIAHSFIRTKIVKKGKIKLFLKEYQKYMKLSSEEKKAIYYLVKYRLFGIIQWYIKYSKERKDKLNELEKGYNRSLARLSRFEKISLNEFLTYY